MAARCVALWIGLLLVAATAPELHAESKPIRIAIYADAGATKQLSRPVEIALPASKGFETKAVSAEEIRSGVLKDFAVVIFPGGGASKQSETLGETGRAEVKRFVKEGGGYIGICAGAYLASAEYPWSLGLLDARVLDRAHWARGEGDVKLKMTKNGLAALETDNEICSIHYQNGPLLGPGKNDFIDDYEPLAEYETEIRDNGAPVGAMKGTTAIARGKFGNGRVICFSPHPERTPGREPFLQSAVRWVAMADDSRSQKKPLAGSSQSP